MVNNSELSILLYEHMSDSTFICIKLFLIDVNWKKIQRIDQITMKNK